MDYLASLDNIDIGRGRMREVLLSLGSTARVGDSEAAKPDETGEKEDANKESDAEGARTAERQSKLRKQVRVEDVLEACAQYGLEDVTRSLCLVCARPLA